MKVFEILKEFWIRPIAERGCRPLVCPMRDGTKKTVGPVTEDELMFGGFPFVTEVGVQLILVVVTFNSGNSSDQTHETWRANSYERKQAKA